MEILLDQSLTLGEIRKILYEKVWLVIAIDCLKIHEKLSPVTANVYSNLRAIVPLFVEDTPKYNDIEKIINYLKVR